MCVCMGVGGIYLGAFALFSTFAHYVFIKRDLCAWMVMVKSQEKS